MLFVIGVSLLALCSQTMASDLDCKQLFQPLQNKTQVRGKWVLAVGTSANSSIHSDLKQLNTRVVKLTADSKDENLIHGYVMDRYRGSCYQSKILYTTIGHNTKSIYDPRQPQKHIGMNVETCKDCLLWMSKCKTTGAGTGLFLFTKTGDVSDCDLEVFKKQTQCLKLPPHIHFGNTDLCPDENKKD